MNAITIVLVEDDNATRRRLADAISAYGQFQLMQTCNCFADASAFLNKQLPDVLLTDLGLPDGSGLDLIRQVRKVSASVEIMVVTVFADEKNVVSALEAGATGYLLKDATIKNIGDAINQLITGYSPLSPAIARHVLKRFSNPQSPVKPSPPAMEATNAALITEREKQVLEYIAKGFSYKETAELLGNSVHTVSSHAKKIYQKLAVKSRSEAVFEAIQLGIINMHQ